jgi:hypothetical protein
MTLRMVVESRKGDAVLALHGWLSGPEVDEFERVVGAAPLPLRIDLTNLADANRLGVAALRAQRDRGARLSNASPYIALLLGCHDEAGAPRPYPRRPKPDGSDG